jgi:chaperonin GroES
MNVRPVQDRIMVRRLEEGEQQIGSIIIPDTAKEKPLQGTAYCPTIGSRLHRSGGCDVSSRS